VAGPPAAPRAGAAPAGPDVLLATKLHVPGIHLRLVPRPRLAQALSDGLARGWVLVCAPAGFGKTTLLADWARGDGRPVAWLSLDAGDNDPARFWRHAIAALDLARPGIAERVGQLLGPPPPRSFEGLVTALINEFATQPGADEVVLVLDDYHLIDSEVVHASVVFLLEHLPPGLHPVLASRADPPLPLARLRGRGQLAELRAAELRFTDQEAAALLGETAGAGLPEAAVAALVARTEGWAAGLQLAGLSLRGQPDAAGFVSAFSGSHRYVLDYLTDEVLELQGEQVREFLLETSVLDRLSGELCDAVTGRAGSQAMLEQVERAGLFLVPLDEVRGWWRYHHLFADLLRARLQRDQPGRVRELHRNAAAWSDEHDLADDAVRHALAAGDAAWAARLIERHVDALLFRNEQATLQRRLETLPAELVRSRPRLLLVQTWIAQWAGEVEAAGPLLDAAEHAFANATDEGFEPSVGKAASLLANVPAAIALARARCRQILYTPPLVTGLAALAWIRQAQGDAGGALEAMGEAERAAPGPAVTGLLNPVPAQRARLLLAQGKVAAAAHWAEERGLGADDEPDYPREREYLVLARVLLAQGRPGLAIALLERLHAAAAAQRRSGSIIEISALRALALAADGEETAAVDALAGALTLGCPQGYVRVFADEGAPMAVLVGRLVAAQKADHAAARGIPPGYLAALLRAARPALGAPLPRRSAAVPPGLPEPLTGRETDVLRLIAAGKPNQQIARELVVTLDTVKKHVSHLLGKIGAANRTEAVIRARQLGLIP
jgi:ATP/maltotriose-dependent transcriptional regulator MalT